MSRRHLAFGAAAAAGMAVPLIPAGPAVADPVRAAAADPGVLARVFDVTRFGARATAPRSTPTPSTGPSRRRPPPARAASPAARSTSRPAPTPVTPSICGNVALYLAENATILAAAPAGGAGYDPAEPGAGNPYQGFGHSHWHNSLIWGEDLENITVFGPGTIDGKGLVSGGSLETAPGQGNKAIALKRCRNVTIREITMVNGGHFGILPTAVDNFRIDNLVIDTNRDGIDIDCCKNVWFWTGAFASWGLVGRRGPDLGWSCRQLSALVSAERRLTAQGRPGATGSVPEASCVTIDP